jgi:hypothetical protein
MFAGTGAMIAAALSRREDVFTIVVVAAFVSTQSASLGGLVALWFGAELSRRWSWLFALALSWYVSLACLVGELPVWLALAVGVTAALLLGRLLVWRVAGFARRARGPSFAGVYLGPLMALGAVALLYGHGNGMVAAFVLVLAIPLAIPFASVVGALLGAER